MAIDFPDAPTVGQLFTAAGLTWQWNGSYWDMAAEVNSDLFVRKVGDTMTGLLTIARDTAPHMEIRPFTAGGSIRPYYAVRGADDARSGYFGYPDPTTHQMFVVADRGPILMRAAPTFPAMLGGARAEVAATETAALIVDSTAVNGPFIELKVNDVRRGYFGFPGSAYLYAQASFEGSRFIVSACPEASATPATSAFQIIPNGSSTNGLAVYSLATYNYTTTAAANTVISSSGYFLRSTSSIRFKRDVEDLDREHARRVFDMRPVWFRSTSPADSPDHSHYGLIAEEVAEVDRRLVQWEPTPDCDCGVDPEPELDHNGNDLAIKVDAWRHRPECIRPTYVLYDRIVPHLISVMKEQDERIADLTAKLEALTARVDACCPEN